MAEGPVALERVDEWRWRIPRDARRGMRVDGLVFADDRLMARLRDDPALVQVANVATLPGIVGASLAMPDVHWGYGFPVGGVAATLADGGVVSPGGIGFDINCGVRLLRCGLTAGRWCAPRTAWQTNCSAPCRAGSVPGAAAVSTLTSSTACSRTAPPGPCGADSARLRTWS